jgi:hypothetical protein
MGLGYIVGDFLTNPSGHPVCHHREIKFILGPDRAQAQARHAGSDFYYINQKPEPVHAGFLG